MRGDVLANAPRYAMRIAHYAYMQAFKQQSVIRIGFGADSFQMRIQPLGAHEGSRGIFMFRERYEPLLRFGASLLRRGDSAIDLGANQGVFTCAFAAAVGPTGKLIAVEPLPWQAERARANLELNGFAQGAVVNKAISDTVGTARLGIPGGDTSASLFAAGGGREIEVQTTTVDEIVREHKLERLSLIKADVEGAEMMAMRGAEATLRQFRPALALEASDPAAFSEVQDFLRPLGYRFQTFDRIGQLVDMPERYEWIENVICTAQAG